MVHYQLHSHPPFTVLEVDHPTGLMAKAIPRQKSLEAISRQLGTVGHHTLVENIPKERRSVVGDDVKDRKLETIHQIIIHQPQRSYTKRFSRSVFDPFED